MWCALPPLLKKMASDKKQLCNESAAESLRAHHKTYFRASLFNQKTNYNRVLMKMPINFVWKVYVPIKAYEYVRAHVFRLGRLYYVC